MKLLKYAFLFMLVSNVYTLYAMDAKRKAEGDLDNPSISLLDSKKPLSSGKNPYLTDLPLDVTLIITKLLSHWDIIKFSQVCKACYGATLQAWQHWPINVNGDKKLITVSYILTLFPNPKPYNISASLSEEDFAQFPQLTQFKSTSLKIVTAEDDDMDGDVEGNVFPIFQHLKDMNNLTDLDYFGTANRMPFEAETLYKDGTFYADLHHMTNLVNLTNLKLALDDVLDPDFSCFSALTNLKNLFLECRDSTCHFERPAARPFWPFGKLTKLTSFRLDSYASTSFSDFSSLSTLKSLTWLDLDYALAREGDLENEFKNISLDFLATFTNLTYLNLTDWDALTDTHLEKILPPLSKTLQELHLGFCSSLTTGCFNTLSKLTNLELLDVNYNEDLLDTEKKDHLTYAEMKAKFLEERIDLHKMVINRRILNGPPQDYYPLNHGYSFIKKEAHGSLFNLKKLKSFHFGE